MEALLAIIVALVGAFFYQKSKRDSAEALLENNNVVKEDNKLQAGLDKINVLLEHEEDVRKEKTDEKDLDAIVDFLNKPKYDK